MRPFRTIGSSFALVASLATLGCRSEPVAPSAAGAVTTPPSNVTFHSLISCPATAALHDTLTIDASGGSFALGPVEVVLPAGAVAEPTLFSIDVPVSQYLEFDVSAVGQDHFRFAQTISVSVDYSRCGSGVDQMGAFWVWYVGDDGRPLERMPTLDDRESRRLTFLTPHLSGYAIAD